jgi:hypothetical protein
MSLRGTGRWLEHPRLCPSLIEVLKVLPQWSHNQSWSIRPLGTKRDSSATNKALPDESGNRDYQARCLGRSIRKYLLFLLFWVPLFWLHTKSIDVI